MYIIMEIPNSQELPMNLKPQYRDFLSELENLYKCNPKLAQEFKVWPRETEWRPESTFKDPNFEWKLSDRIDSFKRKLIDENPQKYEDVITLYCELYLKLERNPTKIDSTHELRDILSKETIKN